MISLPIDEKLDEIAAGLKPGGVLAVVSPPGSGKSTRVAPFLVRSGHSKKAVMLQPRRIAVRSLAKRICDETGTRLGEEVGYQIRFEDRSSPRTILKILTEGLLSRQLMSQGDLSDIDLVVFDEFHERSLHTDVSFGMCLDLQRSIRPDLKILVMSATLDVNDLYQQVRGLQVIESAGRSFPIDIRYSNSSMSFRAGRDLADRVVEEYASLQMDPATKAGDTLVFLPGMAEIRQCQERFQSKYRQLDVIALHSQVEDREQDRVFEKPTGPRVVLSTNIAETSVTLPYVTCVMDSGLKRSSSFDFVFGVERLDTVKISRASATQRAGRAGRIQAGVALRLWTRIEQDALPETDLPEILRSDLLELRLWLARWGVRERKDFPWVTEPLAERWKMAETELLQLGALEAGGKSTSLQMTKLGRVLLDLPLSPRMGRVLLEGYRRGVYKHVARFAADQSSNTKRARTIHGHPLESILFEALPRKSQQVEQQLMNMERRFREFDEFIREPQPSKSTSDSKNPSVQTIEEVAKCILASFPSRVCKRRSEDPQRGLMASGRGVQHAGAAGNSTDQFPEWFVALDPREPPNASAKRGDALVSLALPIQPEWLQEVLPHNIYRNIRADFTSKEGRVMIYEGLEYLGLPLRPPHQKEASADMIYEILSKRFLEEWPGFVKSDEPMQQLASRILFLEKNAVPGFEGGSNDLADTALAQSVCEIICMGCTSWNEVLAKNWTHATQQVLDSNMKHALESYAPSEIVVPAGSRIPVDYRNADGTPRMAVRLQEIFGWLETPRLADGKVPILIELLAPNFRPVQLTRDLASFWKTAYFEVRRDLRIRYPKHSWPEDPLTAKPEAKGRRRG